MALRMLLDDQTSGAAGAATLVSDGELLARFRTGGAQEALAELVARHHGMVYRTCLRQLGNAADAEDATQAVFIALTRKAPERIHSLAGWLHQVARFLAIKLLRSQARRAKRERAVAALRPETAPAVAADLREELDQALERLPGPLREAVVLHYLEGRNQEEAAALAGCPRGTLAWRAGAGLDRLRAILSARGTVVAPAALAACLAAEASASAASAPGFALHSCSADATALANAYGGSTPVRLKAAAAVLLAAGVAAGAVYYLPRAAPTEVRGHTDKVLTLAYAPNGRTFASGSADLSIKIWDARTRRELKTLRAEGRGFQNIVFSGDGGLLAAGGTNHHVWVWDTATGEQRACHAVGRSVYGLAFAPNGRELVLAGVATPLPLLLDLENGTTRSHPFVPLPLPPASQRVYDGWGNTVAYAPDGRTIAVGGWRRPESIHESRRRPCIWIFEKDKPHRALLDDTGAMEVNTVHFSPDGRWLTSVNDNGGMTLWDVATGQRRWQTNAGLAERGAGTGHVFVPDGQTLAAIARDGSVELLNADTGAVTETLRGAWQARSILFTPDGRTLLVGGDDGAIHFVTVSGR